MCIRDSLGSRVLVPGAPSSLPCYSLKRLSFGRGDSSQECPRLSHGERRGGARERQNATGRCVALLPTMSGFKRMPAAAVTRTSGASPAGARDALSVLAVETTLREVQAYMQDHAGRLPSQLDPEAKLLYFKFRKLRKRSMPTARAAWLLWAITCAQGARRAGSRGRLSTANFRSVAAARSICRRS